MYPWVQRSPAHRHCPLSVSFHAAPYLLALRIAGGTRPLRVYAVPSSRHGSTLTCWLPVLISDMEALQGTVATRISYLPHDPARISLRINQQVISTSQELILLSVSQRVSSAYPSWCRLSGCHTFRTGRLFRELYTRLHQIKKSDFSCISV